VYGASDKASFEYIDESATNSAARGYSAVSFRGIVMPTSDGIQPASSGKPISEPVR